MLLNGKQKVINAFKNEIIPMGKHTQGKERPSIFADAVRVSKASDHKQLKILTPKQLIQRLLIVLAQVKPGNTCEKLLNEISQILYSLDQAKEITKKYTKV